MEIMAMILTLEQNSTPKKIETVQHKMYVYDGRGTR